MAFLLLASFGLSSFTRFSFCLYSVILINEGKRERVVVLVGGVQEAAYFKCLAACVVS